MPRKRVTVCAGMSWLNATRKAIWIEMPPEMVVRLHTHVCQFQQPSVKENSKELGRGRKGGDCTYVQLSFRVRVKKNTMIKKVKTLGTRVTKAKNLAKSAEDQARSKYRPPWYNVNAEMAKVKTLLSTSADDRNVQGNTSDNCGTSVR